MKPQSIITCVIILLAIGGSRAASGRIIEQRIDAITEARTAEHAKTKGGPKNNKLSDTSTLVRAGRGAFKHWVNRQGERSELKMGRTEIGGEYWYGWSLLEHVGAKPVDHFGVFRPSSR